ncbi:uncharacterized protein LOC116160215 [Photinus pyralis]|nr:uncharacterized protein LOC116160215 [Photinus pyralis]
MPTKILELTIKGFVWRVLISKKFWLLHSQTFIMAERVEEIVSQILNSSTLRNTLETAVRQATQGSSASPDSNPITSAVPPPLARNVATTTREELRRLFPTIRSTSAADQSNRMIASRTNNTRKRKRAHSPVHSNFCRDVLLLKSPRTILTLKGREKTKAFEQGFAFSKVKFNSGWNREEVNTAFRDLFQSLLADVEFELLIPMSGRLVKPNLPPGGELNGDTIRSIFNHKMIYIRPTVQLTTIDVTDYLACPDVLSDSSHEDVDIANPEANPASSESPNEIQDEHPALSLEQSETTSGTNEGHSESEMTLKSLLQNLNEQITEEDVTKFYAFHRIRPALEQFREGLNTGMIYELLKSHPNLFQNTMCQTEDITSNTLEKLFSIMYSEQGSSKRSIENRIISFWRDFLLDCEDNVTEVTLKDVIIFITAAETVPPLGFSIAPKITFLHDDATLYPKANTCALEISLPTCHSSYDKFKQHMAFGIGNCKDFAFA